MAAGLVSLGATLGGPPAQAESAPSGRYVEPGVMVPGTASAVRIIRSDESILTAPGAGAERRGSALREARLPFLGARRGTGCQEPYYAVGPAAWVCGDHVELTRGQPIAATARTFEPSTDGLPYRYYFVGPDGSNGYRKLLEAEITSPDFIFDPGFAVAIKEERMMDGARYGLTGNEQWIPMRDLGPARPFLFQGTELSGLGDRAPGGLPVAWVLAKSARVYSGPTRQKPTMESLPQFAKLDVSEEVSGIEVFLKVGEGRYVLGKDVRRPTSAAPPPDVDSESGEVWLDVELATQTLVAYRGKEPVFATLVSTGKGKQGTSNETPKGTQRVWVKLAASNMDNLEDERASRFYRMETVPYVQFFNKGVGAHGAFWHRSFGNVRSHGCVNLAPLDAQRLFWMTSPRLPAGWTAVLPTEREKGSAVRVR